MEIDEIIRKLRKLKKFEANLRNIKDKAYKEYVWDKFFSTKQEYDLTVKYCLNILKNINHDRRKEVFEEYYFQVYFEYYKESGIDINSMYDPELLSVFGLAPGADIEEIKRKFRELAKKYHPDHGGEHERMIELIEAYNKLVK